MILFFSWRTNNYNPEKTFSKPLQAHSLCSNVNITKSPSVGNWSEDYSLTNSLLIPCPLPWRGTKEHSIPVTSAVVAWFNITSSSITCSNTNLAGIPLIPIEVCLNTLGIGSALRTMLALWWRICCEFQECSNMQNVSTFFRWQLVFLNQSSKKMSLKDVVRLSTPSPFGVRTISEYMFPSVLRIREMRLQLEKAKDGVLFLK